MQERLGQHGLQQRFNHVAASAPCTVVVKGIACVCLAPVVEQCVARAAVKTQHIAIGVQHAEVGNAANVQHANGVVRLTKNTLVKSLCASYVEITRNIPLLLQLFMWYVLLVEWMPDSDAPLHWADLAFFSKSGLTLPWLTSVDGIWLWDIPLWQNDHVTGGASLSPEFVALTWGLTLYTAAFVAEVVRAGLLSVPRGQTEAAQSIGLSPALTLRLVVLPQAMRLIVPPMTNQFLNLTKNSSLAVDIGYPDLVAIANTTMNQTGQAMEMVTIMMVIYFTLSLITSAFMNWFNSRVRLVER